MRMSSQLSKPTGRHSHGSAGGPKAAPASVIPDKLYFRIGEVAKLCSVQTFVLRFWEGEFPQLKPTKSGTGQRLYRKRDVEMALKIRHLLYEEGYTIPGARQAFQQEARNASMSGHKGQPELPLESSSVRNSPLKLQRLQAELREILGMLSTPVGKPRLVNRERVAELKPQLFD
jgi:DNA-binding transcriptional MerR regulator